LIINRLYLSWIERSLCRWNPTRYGHNYK